MKDLILLYSFYNMAMAQMIHLLFLFLQHFLYRLLFCILDLKDYEVVPSLIVFSCLHPHIFDRAKFFYLLLLLVSLHQYHLYYNYLFNQALSFF